MASLCSSGRQWRAWFGPFGSGSVVASKLLDIFISQELETFEANASAEDLERSAR
jgi:hypothetical protein